MDASRKIRKIAARRTARDQARERNDRSLRIRKLLNYRKECLADLDSPMLGSPMDGLHKYIIAEKLRQIDIALLCESLRSEASQFETTIDERERDLHDLIADHNRKNDRKIGIIDEVERYTGKEVERTSPSTRYKFPGLWP